MKLQYRISISVITTKARTYIHYVQQATYIQHQCRINGGVKGAATPGSAVFRARNLRKVEKIVCAYATITGKRNVATEINTNTN